MSSPTPFLTPSRSSSPEPPVQPDHFYGAEDNNLPRSPDSDGKTWLDPEDDPLAQRGIPVFKPTMAEFRDFETYMNRVECWGSKSGIVKIIPPEEWTRELPDVRPQLSPLKIKNPIEQHMMGRGGLFRQENVEKRRAMSIREWVELCDKEEHRAPGVGDVGLEGRAAAPVFSTKRTRRKAVKVEVAEPGPSAELVIKEEEETKHRTKRTAAEARQARDNNIANRAAADVEFNKTFDPYSDWLPPNTKPADYTPEFCAKLERQYWRNCGLSRPAWYGADCQGSLYTDDVKSWNVAHLSSTLSRLLPASQQGLPGVNTPYLYFGMWRATFAWHVEDMDLFSINYIHFGAPKFWYSVPQGRAGALEQTMRGYFPADTSQCPQFLRHKSFLASPSLLAQSACRPNLLVQHAGEFVVTFPRGYHAGFNLGLNCAESVNFALDSWIDIGKRAQACACVSDSVRIDVNQLLEDREAERNLSPEERAAAAAAADELAQNTENRKRLVKKEQGDDMLLPEAGNEHRAPRKRKAAASDDAPQPKKLRTKSQANAVAGPSTGPAHKITVRLKLGPKPTEPEGFPCCLCVSTDRSDLLRVHDPPTGRKEADHANGNPGQWMAHAGCANIIPETWVDEIEIPDSNGDKEKVIFGVDGIVKDRWNLKCSACTKTRFKAHGAPIQCSKGKCPKAFHVSCAKSGSENGIVFNVVQEVEKEVVLMDYSDTAAGPPATAPAPPPSDHMLLDVPPAHSGDAHDTDMHVDVTGMNDTSPEARDATSEGRVIKVIKKTEVYILCSQHNPAKREEKKANKQDKIRNDLLALPPMSRIKVRVSSGVFEVSLIRVIPETGSVEVLWDRGIKREFKWGSVVFGNTDGTVLQKPSELAPDPPAPTPLPSPDSIAQNMYSVRLPTIAPIASSSTGNSLYPYPSSNGHRYNYGSWASSGLNPVHRDIQASMPSTSTQINQRNSYAAPLSRPPPKIPQPAGPHPFQLNKPSHTQPQPQSGWTQSYDAPPRAQLYRAETYNSDRALVYRSTSNHTPLDTSYRQLPPPSHFTQRSRAGYIHDAQQPYQYHAPHAPSVPGQSSYSNAPPPPSTPVASPASMNPSGEFSQLSSTISSLQSLHPEQIAALLREQPDLRDIIWAAVDKGS